MGFFRDKLLDDVLGVNPGSSTPDAIKDIDQERRRLGREAGGTVGVAMPWTSSERARDEFGDNFQDKVLDPLKEGLRPGQVSGTGFESLPIEQQNLLRALFSNAQGLLGQNPLMGFNPNLGGLQQTAQGSFLNSNPFLDQTFNQAADSVTRRFNDVVMPGIGASFGGGGRFGSPAMQRQQSLARQDLGGSLSNLATNIYGGNFQNERNRQFQAQQFLPTFGLNLAQNQAQFPLQQLGVLGGIAGLRPFGDPMHENKGAGLLGGALGGASIGSNFGPWGALIGAGLGGGLASQ